MRISRKKILWGGVLAILGLALIYWSGWHIRLYNGVNIRLITTGVVKPKPLGIEGFMQMPVTAEELQGLVLADPDGQLRTAADYPQQVLFINYWATWCAPCIVEMPGIHTLYRELNPEVGFVMINRDRKTEKARDFLDEKGYEFDILQVRGPAPEKFRTGSIPLTLVVDRKRGVIYRHLGMVDFNTIENREFLRSLLK